MPKVITESTLEHTVLGADYTLVDVAIDDSVVEGPCVYQVTVYATVMGTPGAKVLGRFEDYDVAAQRPSYDLPMEAGTIGPNGVLQVALSRPGALPAGERLRFALRAPGATVTRVILRGLRWQS